MADHVPTNLRTLRILEILGNSDQPMTATEINSQLGLPKQTIHRLCATLEAEGYIAHPGNTRKYIPARRLRQMATGLLFASNNHIARHQVLMEVARRTRETVNFVVPVETGMSYIDRVETDWPFRIQLPVGSSVPFHCTASGKTYMASMPPKARAKFVDALQLDRLTAKTHVTAESLLEDLKRIAKRGFAVDDEEFMEGMVAIAVPVREPNGKYLASLAFHGPVQRLSIGQALERKEALFHGAARLSEILLEETEA